MAVASGKWKEAAYGEILNCFKTSSPRYAELIVISPLKDMPKYTGTIIAVLPHAASHYGL